MSQRNSGGGDDDASIIPGTQTIYDSGFTFDGQAPIALADWNQPANGRDMRSSWSVWPDGVDPASNPDDPVDVPEPGTAALFGLGQLGLGLQRQRSPAPAGGY